MNLSPKTFCASPWTEVRINSDGTLNFCHYADRIGINNTSETIQTISIDHYFSGSQSVVEAKRLMMEGNCVPRCWKCYDYEKNSPISYRSRRNLQFAIFPDRDLIPSFKQSSLAARIKDDLKPRFYHISFSNLCNLACPMCNANDSSALAQDLKRAGLLDADWPILKDWTDDTTWDNFCQHLADNLDIVCIHIMGGEPFYHKRFVQLLDWLISKNHTDFVMTLVSNGTIFDQSIVDRLKKFRSVQLEISLESVDHVNDWVRYPSRTTDTLENIQKFLDNRDTKFDVVLRTVPQIFSVYDYDKLLQWCVDRNVGIDSNMLFNPSFMRPAMLPDHIKDHIKQKLSRFISPIDTRVINIRNIDQERRDISHNAAMILSMLDEQIPNREQQWQDLVDYCKKLDVIRKIDLKDYVPWLASELEKHGY